MACSLFTPCLQSREPRPSKSSCIVLNINVGVDIVVGAHVVDLIGFSSFDDFLSNFGLLITLFALCISSAVGRFAAIVTSLLMVGDTIF